MRYRLTCLTPLLVGDGRKLSPIVAGVVEFHVRREHERELGDGHEKGQEDRDDHRELHKRLTA